MIYPALKPSMLPHFIWHTHILLYLSSVLGQEVWDAMNTEVVIKLSPVYGISVAMDDLRMGRFKCVERSS